MKLNDQANARYASANQYMLSLECEQTNVLTNERTVGWTDGWMIGRSVGWSDGWMDGWLGGLYKLTIYRR